jgi:hypothetical protein
MGRMNMYINTETMRDIKAWAATVNCSGIIPSGPLYIPLPTVSKKDYALIEEFVTNKYTEYYGRKQRDNIEYK